MGGESMNIALEFLRDWLRLLDWVFFKPSALRARVREIAPESRDEKTTIREYLRLFRDNRKLRAFILRTLIFAVLTWLVCASLTNQLALVFGLKFSLMHNFKGSLSIIPLGFAVGAAAGFDRSAIFSIALSLTFGVVFSVSSGVVGNIGGRIAGGVPGGVLG